MVLTLVQSRVQSRGLRAGELVTPLAVALFTASPSHAAPGDVVSTVAHQEAASALLRGNAAQAVTLYTDALKEASLTNDRRGAILNDRAVAYSRSGQTKLAIEDFNRSVQLFPEHAATYNNRGNLLLSLGLAKEAIRDFDRATLLSPGYAAAFANRAGAYDRLGQPAEALRDYTRAIELMPQSAVPLAGRGRILLALGKPHAAIRDFGRAVNTDARFSNAYRGRAAAKLRIERYDDAIEDLSRAIAFDSGNVDVYLLRGHAYLGARNFASAIRDFARAVELDPKSAEGHAGRGLANGYVEAFDEALADLTRAIELDPRNATSFAYRAIVYNEAGQRDVGLKDVETALKLDPNRAEAFWARGAIAEAQERRLEALGEYRRALAANSSLVLVAEAVKRLGGELPDSSDVVVPGIGVDGWNVVSRGADYFAIHPDFVGLRVPLETPGIGQPRLLEWELKKAPMKGIGVLRFYGGTVAAKSGAQDVELAAIVDLNSRSVVAVEPHKLGTKTAKWTWEEGRVIVASVDGVTDEFNLRPGATAAAASEAARRRSADGGVTAGEPGLLPRVEPKPQRQTASRPPQQKQKTIFDLLFGN
jgi:tetratricopeptide (TPR) repeat protein